MSMRVESISDDDVLSPVPLLQHRPPLPANPTLDAPSDDFVRVVTVVV